MAFQDRHYAGDNWSPRRYGPTRSGRGFAGWEVWKKLIALNIAVFLLQIFITRPSTEEDLRRLPYFDPEMYAEYDEDIYAENAEEADSEKDAQPEDGDVGGSPDDETDAKGEEGKAGPGCFASVERLA